MKRGSGDKDQETGVLRGGGQGLIPQCTLDMFYKNSPPRNFL